MRRTIFLSAAVLALAGAPSGAHAATVRCDHLKGKNLAHNGKVKIVVTRLSHGRSRYAGCVLPRGTVHPIGPVLGPDEGGASTSQHIAAIKGTFVAIDYFAGVGMTSTTASDSQVYALATGKSYLYDEQASSEEGQNFGKFGSAVRSFLDSKGRLVAAYDDQNGGTTIVTYTSTGKTTVQDQGPATSVLAKTLALSGSIASWTSGGVKKTATLT